MKRKWIAGCLACFLLLCGCRAVEPIGSVGKDTQTTTQTTAVTTAVQPLISTTQRPVCTTQAPTTTTNRSLECEGYPSQKEKLFDDLQSYRDTLKTIVSSEKLQAVFEDAEGTMPAKLEEYMGMLLQDKFFVIPHLSEAEIVAPVVFSTDGITFFNAKLPDGRTVSFSAYHHKREDVTPNTFNKDFARKTYTTKAGLQVTQTGLRSWFYKMDGYFIEFSVTGDQYMGEAFLDTLTFEKVEIK